MLQVTAYNELLIAAFSPEDTFLAFLRGIGHLIENPKHDFVQFGQDVGIGGRGVCESLESLQPPGMKFDLGVVGLDGELGDDPGDDVGAGDAADGVDVGEGVPVGGGDAAVGPGVGEDPGEVVVDVAEDRPIVTLLVEHEKRRRERGIDGVVDGELGEDVVEELPLGALLVGGGGELVDAPGKLRVRNRLLLVLVGAALHVHVDVQVRHPNHRGLRGGDRVALDLKQRRSLRPLLSSAARRRRSRRRGRRRRRRRGGRGGVRRDQIHERRPRRVRHVMSDRRGREGERERQVVTELILILIYFVSGKSNFLVIITKTSEEMKKIIKKNSRPLKKESTLILKKENERGSEGAKMDSESEGRRGGRRARAWRMALHVHHLLLLLLLAFPSLSDASDSVFSLFNLRDKSRFWSDSVIRGRDFDDLQSSLPAGRLLNYTKSGNIANYLNLLEVDSMYLPVPINFIFIGFEGKGNQEFKLISDELERWFTKIDHVFEHARVPFHKHRHHVPVQSHINYNFSVHAILMREKVTSIFERALSVLARPEDVSVDKDNNEDAVLQVDLDVMDALFAGLVDYLRLENAYNIFISNPKRHNKKPKYGYRRGLSDSEIEFLKQNKSLQTTIRQSRSTPQTIFAVEKIKRPLYEKHPGVEFAFRITEDSETEGWYNMCQDALNNIEKSTQGKDTAAIIQSKVLQILKGKSEDMNLLFEKELKSGDFSNVHAECLTDTWIGKDRWAFIDLSAGPFSWGPAIGGEGVRTELSLPNVEKTIGAIAEISEDEAENRLQDVIQEKFAVFGDTDHQAIDILLAEIDIYELFTFKHCKGRKSKLALCEELYERMRDLKNELQSYEGEEYDEDHKRKAIEALKRMENWNLFTDNHEEHQNYTVARDTFLAHLGATLWSSMRHVISPSITEGAFHYYEKISFQLFFVTQEKYIRLEQLPVDLEALKSGLSSLLLASQKFSFDPHMLPLSEDPALAMAFSVARRAAAVPLLLVNGTYRKNIHTYLDSSILQYQLQRLNEHGLLKGAHAHSRSTLEVPIFWFIYGEPLFVDKHYQAKALSDMVIVVQSEAASWESHLQCNGKSLLWDLRRPIKAALAAASEHLAGLLPLHLVYSQAHEKTIEDWTWSVGCNPYSVTSQGWHISAFQSDTISRSYIITTLDESIQTVNSAIHLLLMERTTEKTFKLFQSQEREVVNKYNYVVSIWRRISTVTGELRYGDAVRLLRTLEDASRGFYEQVNATIATLHPIHCTKVRKVGAVFDLTTIPAFVVVSGIIVYSVLRPRRPKPKIN